ncbi:hypothetical protein DFQ28_000075 [Apophysomyces sp. BC1034]|nr:hypothetical protein DFQ30_006695 [Apophysomyces sp. BC1015]KAG0183204.1 hypothetical protein DFQ29_008564 [Apophysomyces sp. BC1021]KAG0194377.1 hypothetical protein DFQ28_000075 [Apophysomyces sp. BC1034]
MDRGIDLGLERIHRLLAAVGDPHKRLKVVHVAGTNGKGSVCAYIASVLQHHGLRVGRFNSPHLLEPRDSIQIDGEPVDQSKFEHACAYIKEMNAQHLLDATMFECLVASALWLLDQARVDVAVIEVGLGGDEDATNVFEQPLMTIITAIGWDHAGMLGGSILSIARAKAGIMKEGCPVVIAPQDDEPQALKLLVRQAEDLGAPCVVAKAATASKGGLCLDQQVDEDRHIQYDYTIGLHGDYQRANSATAVVALDWLSRRGTFRLDREQFQQGMAQTRWPGRLDWVAHRSLDPLPEILVDGAHNPPATRALREYIDQVTTQRGLGRVLWIIGATAGKDVNSILSHLLRPTDIVFSVPFSQPAGMSWIQSIPTQEIADQAKTMAAQAQACSTLTNALKNAGAMYRPDQDLVVLCGSLYLVADLYRLLR